MVVPLGAQFRDVLAELFDPAEILELVYAALVHLAQLKHVVNRGSLQAVEVAVGLALVIVVYRYYKSIQVDEMRSLKG